MRRDFLEGSFQDLIGRAEGLGGLPGAGENLKQMGSGFPPPPSVPCPPHPDLQPSLPSVPPLLYVHGHRALREGSDSSRLHGTLSVRPWTASLRVFVF